MSETCSKCKVKFSDWFFWPGYGNYCFPCFIKSERKLIITRDGQQVKIKKERI